MPEAHEPRLEPGRRLDEHDLRAHAARHRRLPRRPRRRRLPHHRPPRPAAPPAARPAPPPAPPPPAAPPAPMRARRAARRNRSARRRPRRAEPPRRPSPRARRASAGDLPLHLRRAPSRRSSPSAVATTAGSSRTVRTASSGTASTFSGASTDEIETSPFMPGSSRPFSFAIEISTGNMVTDCWTTACGSIFSTVALERPVGERVHRDRRVMPGRTLPMSVSLTSARIRMRLRSAILSSVVPPLDRRGRRGDHLPRRDELLEDGPGDRRAHGGVVARLARDVEVGARLDERRLRVRVGRASRVSCSSARDHLCANSSSARFFCAPEMSDFACAAVARRAPASYWFCDVHGVDLRQQVAGLARPSRPRPACAGSVPRPST